MTETRNGSQPLQKQKKTVSQIRHTAYWNNEIITCEEAVEE